MAMLRYSLLAAVLCVLLYGITVVGSSIFAHTIKVDQTVDCGSVASNIFYNPFGQRAAVYGRNALTKNGAQVILIGASNVCESFRPAELSNNLNGIRVENFAISGGDPYTFNRLANLALEVIPAKSHKNITLVLGVWYGSFIRANGTKSESEIALENEQLRYGLYSRAPDGTVQLAISKAMLPSTLTALRPFLLSLRLSSVLTWLNDTISVVLHPSGGKKIDPDILAKAGAKIDSKARQAEMIRLRNQMDGALNDSDFSALVEMARDMSAKGLHFVVVDLPLPSWHSSNVAAFQDYQKRKRPYFQALQRIPNVDYINLQSGFKDDGFYDSVHPLPQRTKYWAARLATPLRASMAANTAKDLAR